MTAVALVATAAGFGAAALLLDDGRDRLRRVLSSREGPAAPRGAVALQVARTVTTRPPLAALIAAAGGMALAGPVAGALAAVVAALVARALAQRQTARATSAAVSSAARAVSGFAAELRAGRNPIQALGAIAATAPPGIAGPLGAAAGAVRLGADPSTALRQHATEVPAMERLAACWRVSARTGAGLAEVADALAVDLHSAQRRHGEMAVEVAASRATATLLAALPAVGIALGSSLGAHPLHFLLHTAVGAGVLCVGMLFEVTGLLWTDRMIRGVEKPP